MDSYQVLANAIIEEAAKDYRKALLESHIAPKDRKPKAAIRKLEKFFRSNWFCILTDLNGEVIMKKIQDRVHKEVY